MRRSKDLKNILGHKVTQIITTIIIGLAVLLILYPPKIDFFQKTAEFAPQLMFGMLLISFLFLVFNQTRLMFIGLMATGLIAFYLKMASNTNFMYPDTTMLPKVRVVNFNLSSFNRQTINLDSILNTENADLICFQEYTPDWDAMISKKLQTSFPYAHKMVKANPFGMALYSKKKFNDIRTFYYEKVPNIHILIENEMEDINVICSYMPIVYPKPEMNQLEHLKVLTEHIQKLKKPVISLGDFNMVYWSPPLTEFMSLADLENSRRSGSPFRLKIYDHIFYSDYLECVQFNEIQDKQQNHIGIAGTYQLKSHLSSSNSKKLGSLSNF